MVVYTARKAPDEYGGRNILVPGIYYKYMIATFFKLDTVRMTFVSQILKDPGIETLQSLNKFYTTNIIQDELHTKELVYQNESRCVNGYNPLLHR